MGRVSTIEYDVENQVRKVTSPSGRVVKYSYDQRGLLDTVTDPLNGVVKYKYDNRANLTSVTDERGYVVTITYDELFRATGNRDALGRASTIEQFDANGNVLSVIDRLGRRVTNEYDELNRLRKTTYPDAVSSFTYDPLSRLKRIDDTQTGFVTWDYDEVNRITKEITNNGQVSYGYNFANQVTSMTAADRLPVSYGYDPAGRLQTIAQGAETFTYSYDSLSRRQSLNRPNGVITDYQYDSVNRLKQLTHRTATGSLEDYRYSYNLDDEIQAITSLAPPNALPAARNYDPANAGNRIGQSGNTTYNYDTHGQTTGKTDATGNTNYTWDARGRLTSVSLPNGSAVGYSYDALGRRAGRTANGITTQFLYSGGDIVLDRIGNNGGVIDYLHGAGTDEHLRQGAAGNGLYFLSDHLGSTIGLTNSSGGLVERLNYEPFGGGGNSAFTRYTYTGRERDALTGTLNLRAREYDPQQGRFLTEDPIGMQGGMNLYAYAGNNPINFRDPSGLFPTGKQAYDCIAASVDTATGYYGSTAIGQLYDSAANVVNAMGGIPSPMGMQKVPTIGGMGDTIKGMADPLQVGTAIGSVDTSDPWAVAGAIAQDWGRAGELALYGVGFAGAIEKGVGKLAANTARECPGGLCGCFTAGTKVQTAEGEKNIEDVQEGDLIYAQDIDQGEQPQLQRVAKTLVRESTLLVDLVIGGETITATPDHPFWVVGKGWTDAGELGCGDALVTKDGKRVQVEGLTRRSGHFKVYNFEVANSHSYFVGTLGLLVHNNDLCKLPMNITEEAAAVEKADGLKGQMKQSYQQILDMLSQGGAGGNQHALKGDYAGKFAVDLKGSGKGRGAQRVIFSVKDNKVIIHEIVDYH